METRDKQKMEARDGSKRKKQNEPRQIVIKD